MGKKLLITEKPSVAMEFAKALKINTNRKKLKTKKQKYIKAKQIKIFKR